MILVAGGTGHLGTELVPLLVGQGLRVRVLTRNPSRARQVVGEAAELAHGDVSDSHSLEDAMTGVDAVVSAVTGFGPGAAGPRLVDHRGNVNLIRAAHAAKVGHFVLLSMHGAAADHPMELLRMKHRAEEALRASGLVWTILRPTVFMELWAGIVGDPIVKTGKTTVFGRGDNPINLVSSRDLARFTELALQDPRLRCQAIDIGGPENVTLNQVVRAVETASERTAAVRHVPVPLMRLSSLLMRPWKPDLAAMIGAGVVMDTTDMTFDAAELRRRYPEIELTHMDDAVRRKFGARQQTGDP